MNKMNDPIENAMNGFRAGVTDARIGRPEKEHLAPWARKVLYFCLVVAGAACALVLYSQFAK